MKSGKSAIPRVRTRRMKSEIYFGKKIVIEMFTIMEYNLLMIMKHKRQGMIL